MKQASLDIVFNLILDDVFKAPINEVDKMELLLNLRVFFESYGSTIGGVTPTEKIETIDFTKVR